MRLDSYTLPTRELVIDVIANIENEEQSGETSSTTQVSKGIKAKEIHGSFMIRSDELEKYTSFIKIFEGVDDNGDLAVYTVTEEMVNAAGIRQAKFFGQCRLKKHKQLEAYLVTFTMREHLSVPEKAEQRKEPATSTASPDEGGAGSTATDEQQEEELTGFEKVLKSIDNALA